MPQGVDTDVFNTGSLKNTAVNAVQITGIHRFTAVMGKIVWKFHVKLLKLAKGIECGVLVVVYLL